MLQTSLCPPSAAREDNEENRKLVLAALGGSPHRIIGPCRYPRESRKKRVVSRLVFPKGRSGRAGMHCIATVGEQREGPRVPPGAPDYKSYGTYSQGMAGGKKAVP